MDVGFKLPELEARARHDGTALVLTLRGDASGEVRDPLDKLFTQLHSEAARLGVTEVAVDIRDLEFMSSACFKCLVTWVTDIQSLDDGKQYVLRFISNPNVFWQKRSLRSLHCFAVDLVKVEP